MSTKISVVTPCYNEEGSIRTLCKQVRDVLEGLPEYEYEHICIDNDSKDGTVAVLSEIAREDPRVKVIVNARNFGHIRSPIYGLLQSSGEAAILMASDLQEPPSLIPEFLAKWREGFKIVVGVKRSTAENPFMGFIRRRYYDLVSSLADVNLVKNFTGFGLYDRSVVELVRKVDDPYPYFRGMISEVGFDVAQIPYDQGRRHAGLSNNSFYSLYDMAMLGITSHSKVPLRIATMAGFLMSGLSLIVAFGYLAAKLLFWDWFSVGVAPLLISIFFFSAVQLFFIGILGEYIAAIHTQVRKLPLVVERRRINF